MLAEELMDAGLEIRMDCNGSESENGLSRVTLNVSLSAVDSVTTTLPCNASRMSGMVCCVPHTQMTARLLHGPPRHE